MPRKRSSVAHEALRRDGDHERLLPCASALTNQVEDRAVLSRRHLVEHAHVDVETVEVVGLLGEGDDVAHVAVADHAVLCAFHDRALAKYLEELWRLPDHAPDRAICERSLSLGRGGVVYLRSALTVSYEHVYLDGGCETGLALLTGHFHERVLDLPLLVLVDESERELDYHALVRLKDERHAKLARWNLEEALDELNGARGGVYVEPPLLVSVADAWEHLLCKGLDAPASDDGAVEAPHEVQLCVGPALPVDVRVIGE